MNDSLMTVLKLKKGSGYFEVFLTRVYTSTREREAQRQFSSAQLGANATSVQQ